MHSVMPENEGMNEGRAENFLHRTDGSSVSNAPVNDRVVSLTAPGSVAAEQYRSLYYRLERLREQRPMRLVAFTSARANPDRRILLIDADLRGGQVAELLAFRARPGLSELLQGDAELREE